MIRLESVIKFNNREKDYLILLFLNIFCIISLDISICPDSSVGRAVD